MKITLVPGVPIAPVCTDTPELRDSIATLMLLSPIPIGVVLECCGIDPQEYFDMSKVGVDIRPEWFANCEERALKTINGIFGDEPED